MSRPPFDPPTSRPAGAAGSDPHSTAEGAESSILGRLIRLVTMRTEAVGHAAPGDRRAMEELREAVDALEHYLDAAELVRRAFPAPGMDPSAAGTGSSAPPATVPAAWAEPDAQPRQPEEPSPGNRQERASFPPFRDQVTGAHTRAGFESVAGGELKRCARHARPFSLLAIQLSPHAEARMRTAATITSGRLRASDSISTEHPRVLLVAMPETSIETARLVARRLVDALQAEKIWDEETRFGLSTRSVHGESLEGLIGAARTQLDHLPT